MDHHFAVRVFYEDTDMGGIVYHANFLKFIERGRSDWVAQMGIDQLALRDAEGVVFAVRRVDAQFERPAVYGDELNVVTRVTTVSGAKLVMQQDVMRQDERLFSAEVTVVCMTLEGRPIRLPDRIRQLTI